MNGTPRVLIFTGDGKGKTTAALGMAFRAGGHGLRAAVIQFVKGDDSVGEVKAAAQAPWLDLLQTGRGFLPPEGKPGTVPFADHRAAAQQGLKTAAEAIAGGQYAVVILDEICFAVARGLIDEPQVAELLALARPETCVVLTGRGATPGLIALADTVTEMRCVKHGMALGIAAQEGVER